MNNYINNTGYLDNTETSKNSFNIIPSNIITMKGVSRPLTLVPIVNGKPLYSKKIIAKPGDPDINFGNDVEGVLELPYAQVGMMTNPMFLNTFNGIMNAPNQLNTALDYGMNMGGNDYMSNAGTGDPMKDIQKIYENTNNYNNSNLPYDPNLTNPNSWSTLYTSNQANDRQKEEAAKVKQAQAQGEQKGNPFIGAINPYGGWNMNNASVALGAFTGMKVDPNSKNVGKQRTAKTLGIIGSSGKILSEGARNAFSGAGAMKVYQESLAEQQRKETENYLKSGVQYYQEGGEIPNKEGLLSTGNFIYGNDNHPNPNVEVEKGEYVQTPDGSTMEVLGKKHSEGGEMLNLPQSTTVISDYLKIGSKLATYFKKNYDLNVTSKSTFATVIDRYKRKIGLTKILEEETGILQKITDQEDVEFEPTRDINLQILSKKAVELQSQKQPLEKRLEEFTRVVFDKQELQKGNEVESSYKQEGGDVENINQDGNQIEQLILMFSKITNQDPKQIIEQLQQLPDDQLQNAIQEISKVVQQAMNEQQGNNPQEEQQEGILSNPQEEQQEQMKIGGSIDEKRWLSEKIAKHIRDGRPKDQAVAIAYRQAEEKFGHKFQDGGQTQGDEIQQLISSYAILTQQDPNEIVEQLKQLSGDDVKSALQQMMNEVQQSQHGNVQYAQIGTRIKPINNDYNKFPFTAINIDGYTDYNLQHYNSDKGIYDSFDPNERIGRYLTDVPVGAENYFEKKLDGTYGLKAGKKYSDFQKGYNQLMERNKKFFETLTDDMSEDEKKSYLNNISNYHNDIIFTTDKEKEYKGKTARGIDNKFGQFTSTRSGYQRAIVTPEQLKELNAKGIFKLSQVLGNEDAKKIIGDDLYTKLSDENTKFGGIDYKILDIKPTNSDQKSDEASNPDPNNGLNKWDPRRTNFGNVLPVAVPDQSNLPPNYIPTSMREVKHVQANTINISPEATLGELANQAKTASKVLVEANPYTSAAGIANLQANENQAINQAYMQSEMANQQDQRNVENINEQRIQQRDNTNLNLASQYQKEAITGADNLYQSWRNFIDNKNRQNLENFNLQENVNAYNAMNPNYQRGPLGMYQTPEESIFYVNGQAMYKDPKSGKVYKMTESVDDKGVKTTTTTTKTKGKKGGIIKSNNLVDFLKSINN